MKELELLLETQESRLQELTDGNYPLPAIVECQISVNEIKIAILKSNRPVTIESDPKVGDVGYFWDMKGQSFFIYGTITEICLDRSCPYGCTNGVVYIYFSKQIPSWFNQKS